MKKKLVLMTVLIFCLSVALMSCVTTQIKPTEKNFIAPKIELESFMVPFYDGYWYISSKTKPDQGGAGNRGAFLPMSFVFKITNPNSYPINLEEIKYSVVFDKDFVMITAADQMSNWIPPGKSDEVTVTTMITTRSALVGLLLANKMELVKRKWEMWGTLEKWWKGVPDGTTPVTLTECGLTFTADGVSRTYPFKVEVQ